MTNPDVRKDPWQEALTCYEDFSDELIIVGEDWPHEFKFDLIGKYFQKVLINVVEIGFLEWT